MGCGKDCLFVGQPFIPSFVEVSPEEIVVDNNLVAMSQIILLTLLRYQH